MKKIISFIVENTVKSDVLITLNCFFQDAKMEE